MKIIFLGTGTSQGVPVVGCRCATCTSEETQDKRLRSSIYIEVHGKKLLIDTSPDLRQQLLTHDIFDLDAILFTHEHNDHTAGLDDVRPINFLQQKSIDAYALERVAGDLGLRYPYVFGEQHYPGSPRVNMHMIEAGVTKEISGVPVLPMNVIHGNLPIVGFKIQNFAYITDASFLPHETMEAIRGIDVLVLNALQHAPHHSHYHLSEAIEVIGKIKPGICYLTHMSHQLGPAREWATLLPSGIHAAWDGLCIEC